MRTLSLFAAVLLFASAALAQSGKSQNPNLQNAPGFVLAVPESKALLPQRGPEQRIAREALHQLLMNPYYSIFDDLGFEVQGNTITLLGKVVDPIAKTDALDSLKQIEGVDKVVDKVEVLPPRSDDQAIRAAEYRAVFGFDGLSKYSWSAAPSIHIVVDRGHVTLVGTVLNEGDRDAAGVRANSVPGVFSVDNNLQVINSKGPQTAKK